MTGESPRGIEAKMLGFYIAVSWFELHSRNYVRLWTDTPEKGIKTLIPSAMG